MQFNQQVGTCNQTATANVTVTLTWAQDGAQDTEPPPTSVSVIESGDVTGTGSGPVGASATAVDGMGDDATSTNPPNGDHTDFTTESQGYKVLSGFSGASFTVTLPTMKVTYSGGGNGGGGFGFSLNPVYIQPNGATPYQGAYQVLAGQQITANLIVQSQQGGTYPLKSGTRYAWQFNAGSNFNTYNISNTNYDQLINLSHQADPNTGDTDYNKTNFTFYTKKNEKVTIQCMATLSAPTGTDLPVTVTQDIKSVKPTVDWVAGQNYGTPPYVQGFVGDYPPYCFSGQELWGPMTIKTAAPFVNADGSSQGQGCLIQIGIPTRANYRHATNGKSSVFQNITITESDGTQGKDTSPTGLDGAAPYLFGRRENSDNKTFADVSGPANGEFFWPANIQGFSGDQPSRSWANNSSGDGGGDLWYQANADDTYYTWVMFKPPGSNSVYIALRKLIWSWDGEASTTDYQSWSWGGSVSSGKSQDTTDPPQWNTILSNPLLVGP